jgi:hypothetical protein
MPRRRQQSDLKTLIRREVAIMHSKQLQILPGTVVRRLKIKLGSAVGMLSGAELETAANSYLHSRAYNYLKQSDFIIGVGRDRVPFWEATFEDLRHQYAIREESSDFDQPNIEILGRVMELLEVNQGSTTADFYEEIVEMFEEEEMEVPKFYREAI